MSLHPETFDYVRPTDDQMACMDRLRAAAAIYADVLDDELIDGPDKTYLLRKLREVAMWANVCATREADGRPRSEAPG